jgi:hypothetical protein
MANILQKIFPWAYSVKTAPAQTTQQSQDTYSTVTSYLDRNYLKFLSEFTNVTNRRSEVYNDVKFLDEDELINRALDVYSEDCLQIEKVTGKTVLVKSKIPSIEKELVDLFNRLQIEDKLPLIAREVAKYGDKWVELFGSSGKGLQAISIRPEPDTMIRFERQGQLSAFLSLSGNKKNQLRDPWEFVQFSRPGQALIVDDIRSQYNAKYNNLFDPDAQYGTSMIYQARKIGKKLNLAMDSLAMARLSMGITTQIHNLEVGNATAAQQLQMISDYLQHFKRRDKVDQGTGFYKSDWNPLGFGGIIVNPTRNGKGAINVQTFGSDANIASIVDVDKLEARLFAALGIPVDYISYAQGTVTNVNLLQLDIRYARSIMRLQKAIITGLLHIAQIHLGWKFVDPDPANFEIRLVPVSSINETERVDVLTALTDLSERIFAFITKDEQVDKSALMKYLMTYFLQLPNLQMEEIFKTSAGEPSPTGELLKRIVTGKEGNLPPNTEEKILNVIATDPEVRVLLDKANKRLNEVMSMSEFGKLTEHEAQLRKLPEFTIPNKGQWKTASSFKPINS